MSRPGIISVVIVNYFSEHLTSSCIRSISVADPEIARETEFIVVDNGSKEVWGPLLEGLPPVSLIKSDRNLGFARGANEGIQATQSEYILLVNPDTVVCPGAVSAALDFIKHPANHRVAILGPKVYDDAEKRSVQPSARSFPDFSVAIAGRSSLLTRLWPTNPWSQRFLQLDRNLSSPTRVDWVGGCWMLIRRAALEQIGLFDERYFMHGEDVDLCRRTWAQGWEVVHFPGAEVIHQGQQSTNLHPIHQIVNLHRSAWVYYTKFFRATAPARALVFVAIWARAVLAVVGSLVNLLFRRLGKMRAGS